MIEVEKVDYKEEYYKLKDRYDALSCKCELMHGDFNVTKHENEILKAQLDIVHLIFGR